MSEREEGAERPTTREPRGPPQGGLGTGEREARGASRASASERASGVLASGASEGSAELRSAGERSEPQASRGCKRNGAELSYDAPNL